ncbi:uncharacterized protein LOC132530904 [Lagenorhynchus albirostris]|uniref:uncharacterized protein LOC132530904 n=1 Tax=Lagenorhynchus albirostris TaxID=27610 RepID=UPI0028EBAF1A|nr:uncharacterized protein LOC132530904 [Lagenorhynchus albirostris]
MHPGGAAQGSQSEGRAESTEPEPSHVGDPCAQGPDQPQLKVMKAFLRSPREKEHRSRWGAGRPKPGRPGLSPACELGRRSGLKELGARAPGWLAALRGPCLCVKHTAFGRGPRLCGLHPGFHAQGHLCLWTACSLQSVQNDLQALLGSQRSWRRLPSAPPQALALRLPQCSPQPQEAVLPEDESQCRQENVSPLSWVFSLGQDRAFSSGSNCTAASGSVKSGSQDQPRAAGPPSADLPCGPHTVAQTTSQRRELNSWPRLPCVSKNNLPYVTRKLDSDKQRKPFDVKLLITVNTSGKHLGAPIRVLARDLVTGLLEHVHLLPSAPVLGAG